MVVDGEAACYLKQQALRASLLDSRGAISFAPARDLAAHMLLAIDDLTLAGNIAAQWLQERVQGERVDGNIGSPSDAVYVCGRWESVSAASDAWSAKGATLDNTDPGMRYLWKANGPLILEAVSSETAISPAARAALLATGTKAKMIMPMRTADGRPFGLMSVDRLTVASRTWDIALVDLFRSVLHEVVSPILAAAKSLHDDQGSPPRALNEISIQLTEAEIRVARLAAKGLGYKEIARDLQRSVHTIDHQLRSIRTKLGISTHARLVQFLSRQLRFRA
ncbi:MULTISPECIES: helix-turn-helix transcriptional regulator [unclassified Bradyrhizobium]|uniref:helix-turn-helix transcriptional regulator n=1 Tax=unclassified Bradyrhizobium TaxID=2631580 RepID=UPI0028F14D48|nr:MULTISPECIES: helix-turn-helix transcriptional regulator [unclassified Bradyrhizobium]